MVSNFLHKLISGLTHCPELLCFIKFKLIPLTLEIPSLFILNILTKNIC